MFESVDVTKYGSVILSVVFGLLFELPRGKYQSERPNMTAVTPLVARIGLPNLA